MTRTRNRFHLKGGKGENALTNYLAISLSIGGRHFATIRSSRPGLIDARTRRLRSVTAGPSYKIVNTARVAASKPAGELAKSVSWLNRFGECFVR